MDHSAPPPYSETDIYSNPGTAIVTPTTSHADSASLPAPSAASSADDSVIFTPPYTPTDYAHQSLCDELDHISSSAASAYFDSRPAHGRPGPIPHVHTLTITSTTEPKDIPYPEPAEDWRAKDVTEQDWATFVNYLLPDHAASANSVIADRKLKAKLIDERMHRLTLGRTDRSRTDMAQVDAQLEPLRQTPEAAERLGERLTKIDATISEWNAGFFEPRGFQIRFIEPEITVDSDIRTMPGAWVPDDAQMPERPFKRGFSFAGIEASSRGFRFGPIRADHDGFRIGKNGLVADPNGFRMGNMLVADNNGFRLGGPRGFIADHNGLTLGGRVFGTRRDDIERGFDRGRGDRRGHHGHHGHHGRGRSHDFGRYGGRRGRSSSSSSSSSSSCSSSSDSDASVGSLPDYDHLKDQQLPIARQALVEWLNHPEQPINRETVRNIREEIKVAKKSNPRPSDQDVKNLRAEVKDLMKEFKEAQKAQKIFRRQVRKEKRAARRARKKERRAAKKEERRQRKGKYREDQPAPGSMPAANPGMANPHMPAMPSMPAMPHMPTMPQCSGPRTGFPVVGRGPFGRVWPPAGGSATAPPGMSAMHGGWPFTRGLSSHGFPTMPGSMGTGMGIGGPVPYSASVTHRQAQHIDEEAARQEAKAVELRAAATGRRVGEKEKLKKIDEAARLEEEAEKFRREAERLRAEASHLDGELARELGEDGEQATGVIQQ